MPSKERVLDLVSHVESGDFLGAMQEFYADEVSMQENSNPPMVGRAENYAREQQFVAGIRELHESRAKSVLVDGDRAAINWILDFTGQDGNRYRMNQVAHQTWQGDQIVEEQFFYDSAAVVVQPVQA